MTSKIEAFVAENEPILQKASDIIAKAIDADTTLTNIQRDYVDSILTVATLLDTMSEDEALACLEEAVANAKRVIDEAGA